MVAQSSGARFQNLPSELVEDIGRYLLEPVSNVKPDISQHFIFKRTQPMTKSPVRYTKQSVKEFVSYRAACQDFRDSTSRLFSYIVDDTEYAVDQKSLKGLLYASSHDGLRSGVRTVNIRIDYQEVLDSFTPEELKRYQQYNNPAKKSRMTLQSSALSRSTVLSQALAAFPDLESLRLSITAAGINMQGKLTPERESVLLLLGIVCSVIRDAVLSSKRPCIAESIDVAIQELHRGISETEVETVLQYFPLSKKPNHPSNVRATSHLPSPNCTVETFNNAWGIVHALVHNYPHIGTLSLDLDLFNNPNSKLVSTAGHRRYLGFEGLLKHMEYWRLFPNIRTLHLGGIQAGALDLRRFLERVRHGVTSLTISHSRLIAGGWKFLFGYLSQWQLKELHLLGPEIIGEYGIRSLPVRLFVDGRWRNEVHFLGPLVSEQCLAVKVLYPPKDGHWIEDADDGSGGVDDDENHDEDEDEDEDEYDSGEDEHIVV
ncbi:hypothetical protein P152DRAFT_454749 [Eremomyces bilateralis CBS 781.70]|uniref:Uncharacterized protein n=1 Tax=Eremomyces bilateralis CBS 781.70 TaxID=1392243 RepID=A0A6G1GEZ1_9PEZI|nr:uncharacterized protein P152DRAFT_454749 [Eremomyces bilateralis CBS 781.70]KAF1816486.1 hypothetical protein P152DRAFT_454749 [Eremomyces bilateralis CBS 781.70]